MFPSYRSQTGLQQVNNYLAVDRDAVTEFSDFPLERCMRILPHDQNGGAFFIAVFRKLGSLPDIRKKTMSQQETLPSAQEELSNLIDETNLLEFSPAEDKDRRGKRYSFIEGKWKGVDPVVFLKGESIIDNIKSFYGIADSFPLKGHLVTRNSDSKCGERVYYISKSVKDRLELNFQAGQQLKIHFVGLKMFERKRSNQGTLTCPYRITSEGLPLILPYITKQILYASGVDFRFLLQYKSIKFADFVDHEFSEKAWKLIAGCCIIVLGKGSEASKNWSRAGHSSIAIGCWKGKTSLNLMVSPLDCQEMLQRLFSDQLR